MCINCKPPSRKGSNAKVAKFTSIAFFAVISRAFAVKK